MRNKTEVLIAILFGISYRINKPEKLPSNIPKPPGIIEAAAIKLDI